MSVSKRSVNPIIYDNRSETQDGTSGSNSASWVRSIPNGETDYITIYNDGVGSGSNASQFYSDVNDGLNSGILCQPGTHLVAGLYNILNSGVEVQGTVSTRVGAVVYAVDRAPTGGFIAPVGIITFTEPTVIQANIYSSTGGIMQGGGVAKLSVTLLHT